ncbi:hypothetical protein J7M00_08355 [bacterium]|nr:hypothetical protein [bacterium]
MDNLISKLKSARTLISLAQAGINSIYAFAIIVILFWFGALLNGFFWFDIPTRTALFFIWLGISAFIFLYSIIPPLARPISLRRVAMEFEKKFPQLREHLIAAYDLSTEDFSEYGYSRALVEAVINRAGMMAKKLPAKKLLPSRLALERTAILSLALLVVIGSVFAMPEKFTGGAVKMMMPFTEFVKPTDTMLIVKLPNNSKAVKFEDYTITIRASGKIPDRVWIYRKLGKQGYSPFEAQPDPTNPAVFRYTFRKLVDDVEFFVVGGDFRSRNLKISVLDLPRIIDVSLEYRFPAYTRLASQRIERNDGNIDVIYGTKVLVEALASKKIVRGEIRLSDSTVIPMECDGRNATGIIDARKNGSYTIQIWDEEGNSDPQPPRYSIRIQQDEAPVVQITLPGKDVDMNESMKLPIQIYGEDDFGFSKFLLKFYIPTQDSTVHTFKLPFSLYGKKQVVVDFIWKLDPLGLIPNDIVKYWVEGYDNDNLCGPKMGKSKVYAVRFPSIDEIIEEVTGEQEQQTNAVDEALKQQKELAEKMEEMARQVQNKKEELSYEQREEAQRLLERQQQLARQLQETAEKMKKTIERIEQNKLVAQQIVEKMWQIQQILEDILPEELKDAMKKMQEALKNMDPDLLRQAMKQFKTSQQELLKKLDRTLELLKRIQTEMKLDELKNMAKRLKELQDKINEGLKSGEDMEKLQRMESEAKNQLGKMEKQAKELAEQMKQFEDMPSEEMEKLAQELEKQNLPEEAQNAINQMKSGNRKGARKSGQKISSQLEKMAQQMEGLQQQMNSALKQELTMDIQRTVRELLYISQELEDLQSAADVRRERDEIIALAEKQEELRTVLRQSLARVGEMSGKTFLLPPAIASKLAQADANMSGAAYELSQGHRRSATIKQSDALGGINSAAEMLLRTMNSMCQSSSSSGMEKLMQMMKSMCNKQGQINEQTIPMMGACNNPGGMTPEQMAAASRLAAEQEALRKTIDEMRKEFEQHSNLLGKMEGIAEDMKKVEQDLRNFNVNERTLKRQDRILSRMLDAQKSLHKREFTEKRRSRTGKDVVRKSPDQLPEDLGERRNILQQSLLQILSNPYPRQYQEQVRKYFRALEKNVENQQTPK